MDLELEPRVKILPYKVRGVSREAQKAAHVLDTDLRTHWSTSTNTKEWLLLELEEPCLLSHIRIHNKSVLEWEISVGLRYKQPDTFLKVRPRCEAPRREIQYHIGYVPCRFVRISCLRGNPIAIFFIQLIGIPMPGLEPEFQPVVDHLLPQITSHKQDPQDLYLQLLQDVTVRLSPFLPHLEGELAVSSEAMDSNIRFLAMLAGPFYPILTVVSGRETAKNASSGIDQEPSKSIQASVFTVSSNFQAPPRRSRSPAPSQQPPGHLLAFRPDVVILLLKVAYKDPFLGVVCRLVARLMRKLSGSMPSLDSGVGAVEVVMGTSGQTVPAMEDLGSSSVITSPASQTDYSSLFGEDFKADDDGGELVGSAVVDIAVVEEGLLHFLYACASQPLLCRRLAEAKPDLSPTLPFVQAMLPALRPPLSSTDHIDESFVQWQVPLVQRALTQVVAVSTSPSYRPLLDACAGYLSSYSLAHEKAACVLIDLCSGPLAPWLPMVIAKVDLAIEIVEDLLGVIQVGHQEKSHARAALIYLMLGLSGHLDDVLTQYKDVKHTLIFLIEMLEPFLIPAITPVKNTIAFGDVSAVLLEKQERTCAIALDLLRTAIQKPAVLPALEAEWRRGHVMPSVLLSILAPHVPLPPGIDLRRSVIEKCTENEFSVLQGAIDATGTKSITGTSKATPFEEDGTVKSDLQADSISKADTIEDPNLLFAPTDLRGITLRSFSSPFEGTPSDGQTFGNFSLKIESKPGDVKEGPTAETMALDLTSTEEYFNLQAEYLQLVNYQERELKASEFIRFASELHSRIDTNWESHLAAIDALLLAAECHLNPFFMIHSTDYQQLMNKITSSKKGLSLSESSSITGVAYTKENKGWELISQLEEERDKAVLHILLKAAEWDSVRDVSEERPFVDLPVLSEFDDRPCGIFISAEDAPIEDATTLVRKNQGLLCKFLVHQLQRERHNMYEVLLQGFLFLLYSSTRLSAPPEHIVDVILKSAERLNTSLLAFHGQLKEGSSTVGSGTIHSIRRQWALLDRLVVAASGGGSACDNENISSGKVYYHRDLVPATAWISRITHFSSSSWPLVRYIGWKALAHFANLQRDSGLLLASDMQQLTSLLSIFSDELTSTTILGTKRKGGDDLQLQSVLRAGCENILVDHQYDYADRGGLVAVLYPELDLVFPKLRFEFSLFADAMLEAVCLHLKAIPPSSIPDILSWFSQLCCSPFPEVNLEQKKDFSSNGTAVKGYVLANVRFIVLRLLEVIVGDHMEAILPEVPRVLDVVLSLCCSSYCDVPLLESVLTALKPIISYAVASAAASEYQLEDDPTALTFQSLCFDSLIDQVRAGPDTKEGNAGQGSKGALLLFLSGFLLSDLSAGRRKELMNLLLRWVKFASYSTTNSYYNYLCAFQKIVEACDFLVQETLENSILSLEKRASLRELNQDVTPRVEPSKSLKLSLVSTDSEKDPADIDSVAYEELQGEDINFRVTSQPSTLEETLHTATLANNLIWPANEGTFIDRQSDILFNGDKRTIFSSWNELEEFGKSLQALIFALGSSLEMAWKLHAHLAEKITHRASNCIMGTSFLLSNYTKMSVSKLENGQAIPVRNFDIQRKEGPVTWQAALEAVAQNVMTFQRDYCWQVSAAMMDFLLSLPSSYSLSEILPSICSALQYQCNHAPRVLWRLRANKWLSKVLTRLATDQLHLSSSPLIQLVGEMLEHSEPEQRAGALEELEKLVELDEQGKMTSVVGSLEEQSMPESWQIREFSKGKLGNTGFVSAVVTGIWDRVASLAACDTSLSLRKQAMELLLRLIPLAQSHQLHAFLSSVDAILPGLTKSAYTMKDGPLTRLALALLACACLYSSPADIDAISPSIWESLDILAKAKPGSIFYETEREICIALLQLREHGEDAKQTVQKALSKRTELQQANPEFTAVRERVLEVLARMNAIRIKVDASSNTALQEEKELEEAEIEFELLKQEQALQERAGRKELKARLSSSCLASSSGSPTKNVKQRLKELRAQILAEEHSATRAEISARRERQRIARRDRQLALEDSALKEIDLLQELDRERSAEAEREIERKKNLERERAKTRELQYSVDLEAEKRTQRELQREMEQRESGAVRSSRRELSSSTPSRQPGLDSRPRERYRERERESGRSSQDSRPSSSGGTVRELATTPPATPTAGATSVAAGPSSISTVMIATSAINSRAYPGQALAFTHSRDRTDDRGYDESFDGSGIGRESAEGSIYGDMDGGAVIESGSTSSLGGSHRQGPRPSRPRQIVERRERDTRREGKWERKQT